jgi:gluconate 2-dehydrogenase gamma chain
MSAVNRRELLQTVGATAALMFTWTPEEAAYAAERVRQARAQAAGGQQYAPRFFTAPEYATIVALSDLIIPRDPKSGSASDAGAPEFIDYIVAEQSQRQMAMRGGLVWLDTECRRRFDRGFLECSETDRRQVLDDIAWPRRARPEMSHGVAFFNTMRDLVATGFWSSRLGVEDLGYIGNRPVAEWTGAPAEVLKKLGVGY